MQLIKTEIRTTNDRNGNSRGFYIISRLGDVITTPVDIIPLDASGKAQARTKYPTAIEHISVTVTSKEYKWWKDTKKNIDESRKNRKLVCEIDGTWVAVLGMQGKTLKVASSYNTPDILTGIDNLALFISLFPQHEFRLID